MFKPVAISMSANEQLQQPHCLDQGVVNSVFKVFHGCYGNLFLAKFATGQLAGAAEVDSEGQSIEGQDRGVLSARKIWAHGLRFFDASTVKTALAQCMERYQEFPPSLPQLTAICAANKPRQVYKPEVPAISMGQALRSRYAAQARAINARCAQKAVQNRLGTPAPALGLVGLMEGIANAVANAGGDEVAELIRLEAMLTPKSVLAAKCPPTQAPNRSIYTTVEDNAVDINSAQK